MESEWELDRVRLYQLRSAHADWTLRQLAEALKRSLSWAKKWLKRFRETGTPSLAMFKSQSRAPHHHPFQIVPMVRDAILSLRDDLKHRYGRVVGAKTILYHLHHEGELSSSGEYLPRSPRKVWQILKAAGRIPTRVTFHHPVERPAPLQHWEMDFGQLGNAFEFLTVVDRGTSIVVDTPTQPHFNAETALLTVAQLLLLMGLPSKLRFDNDPRFVGSWQTDGFPSALMRFLLCLGVTPDIVEPGRPQDKPFAERSVRTLKYECLWLDPPRDWLDAAAILRVYRDFYNHERAHQSLVCGNRPPFKAFPNLPVLPPLPDPVDPDAWLTAFHRRIFRRRVGQNGTVGVGRHDYYVGYHHTGQRIGVQLDAQRKVFRFLQGSTCLLEKEIQGLVGHPLAFQAYLEMLLAEARTTNTR